MWTRVSTSLFYPKISAHWFWNPHWGPYPPCHRFKQCFGKPMSCGLNISQALGAVLKVSRKFTELQYTFFSCACPSSLMDLSAGIWCRVVCISFCGSYVPFSPTVYCILWNKSLRLDQSWPNRARSWLLCSCLVLLALPCMMWSTILPVDMVEKHVHTCSCCIGGQVVVPDLTEHGNSAQQPIKMMFYS